MDHITTDLGSLRQWNFFDFKAQQEIVESFPISPISATVFTPIELFQFLNKHFKEFYHCENIHIILAFIHRCVKMWANMGYFSSNDIGMLLVEFLEEHEKDEREMNVTIQIVYQILNSTKCCDVKELTISQKLFCKLLTLLPSNKNMNLISNIIACIHFYTNMFPSNCDTLINVWTDLLQEFEANSINGITDNYKIHILIQLFDVFKLIIPNMHNDPILQVTVQNLLKSDDRTERKCAYYLLKKLMICLLDSHKNSREEKIAQQIEQSWTLYITLLENLEEEQSHLILPSLKNLSELIKNQHIPSCWILLLYRRILTHNNNLVLRWSIEFFLKTFSCSDLNGETLKYLLRATNSSLIYNSEGYFLNLDYFSSFLNGNVLDLYKNLAEIENWKSVPLYIWLKEIKEKAPPQQLSYELVLNISACVRKLQNCAIRGNAIRICNEIFDNVINKMSIEEYVKYVETLYNSSDEYIEHQTFFDKKSTLNKTNVFTKRFYEIFTNSINENVNDMELFKFLNNVPIEYHCWLKFSSFFIELNEINERNIMSLYGLNLTSLKSRDLSDIVVEFKKHMLDSPLYDIVCLQAAFLFYINQKNCLSPDDEDFLRIILDAGINKKILTRLTKILENTKAKFDKWIIEEIIRISSDNECSSLVNYLVSSETDYNVACKYILKVVQKMQRRPVLINIPYDLIQYAKEEFFNYSVSKGETRIEQAFCFKEFNIKCNSIYVDWLQQIKCYGNEEYILFLLNHHRTLSKKRPRYFENSYEHRIKLRIATGILYAFLNNKTKFSDNIMDQIWNILLNENNQLNIIYIYEYILGTYESRNHIILENLEKVHNLTSSQQVSIILVTYNFSLQKTLTSDIKNKILFNMLALTMGANFQTRLFAQMTMYKLLHHNKFKDTCNREQLINSIEYATGIKLIDYLNDLRIHMANFILEFQQKNDLIAAINLLLYITNAPFDECIENFNFDAYTALKPQIVKCHETFMKKYKTAINDATTTETIVSETVNDQLQRKMNPVNDLTEPSDLFVYPVKEKCTQMFVIASLIDKLPNLGGIARTCEVLGIQNLVVESKMHTEKSDFKNLSMTAEKSLNILEVKPNKLNEFLLKKKLEGFKIVGAEQTSNSQNFNDFKFPQKSVLLLGHEKDGIPASLLALLDYAVEIPQFGQVRSLNVHVTGALFMWEYCKQHIIQKTIDSTLK